MRHGATAALLQAAFACALGAQAPFDTAAAFDRGDRESRTYISMIRCSEQVAKARRDGRFGAVDSLGGIGQCIAKNGRWIGVFFDTDSQFVRITRLAAVDLASGAQIGAFPDTAQLLAVARAEQAAVLRGMGLYEAANRPFSPTAFRFGGDTIEVWLVPTSVITGSPFSVGGETGFIFSPDGRTLVREVNDVGDYRLLTVEDTGVVRITSKQDVIPTFAEFVLANLLNGTGRDVSIELGLRTSLLTGRGAQAAWLQIKRKRPAV